MAGSFGSLAIARSGMYVSEQSLYITGHNISNVNTTGYSRQQAITMDKQSQPLANGYQFGIGADIQQIRQIRNTFLDNIYRKENTSLGYWETRSRAFDDVQAIMAETDDNGLQSVMNQFWDSWQELSKEPDSLTARAMVRQRGESLVYQINHLGDQLDQMQSDLNSEVKIRIDEVNQITSEIAGLNVQILKVEATGDMANDYRDSRNLLVDRLSKLVDADVNEMQDGQLAITVDGYFIVNKDKQTKLYAGLNDDGSYFYVPKIEGTDVEMDIKSGIIKGLLESRGNTPDDSDIVSGGGSAVSTQIPGNIVSTLKRSLNNLVSTLCTEVNKLHCSGKTMNPAPNDPGQDLFVAVNPDNPISMTNIKLNDDLIDLNNIVASESGDSGDNTIALEIANLRNESLLEDETGTLSIDGYYQAILSGVANSGSYAVNIYSSQQQMVNSSDQYRQSISGVSMDEEMSNMLKYKFAYNASARAMNVIDEMLDTIISRMGLTGR